MARDVFISYCEEDKEIAQRLCEFLEWNSISAWMAPRDVLAGQDWPTAIAEGIGRSHLLLVILSANLRKSSRLFVAGEVSMAAGRRLGIIAFRVDNVQPPPNIELFLGNRQWIDAFGRTFDAAARAVADAIRNSPGFPARPTKALSGPEPFNNGKQSRQEPNRRSRILKLSSAALLFALLLGGFLYNRNVVVPRQQENEAYQQAKQAARQGDYSAAISNFSRVIELDSTNAQVFAERGQAYLNLGKKDLARSDIDRAIQLGPAGNAAIHLLLAGTLERLYEYKRAGDQYDLYLASNGKDPGQIETAQRARSESLDKAEARAAAESWVLQLDSESPPGKWITILPRRKQELGTITHREFMGCEKRPDRNLQCSFASASNTARSTVEIVVLKKTSPGQWQVDGYGWK